MFIKAMEYDPVNYSQQHSVTSLIMTDVLIILVGKIIAHDEILA
jgi:hypothetical protein